jgi:hypothetical protein
LFFKGRGEIAHAKFGTKLKARFSTLLFVQQLFDNLIAAKTILGESNNSHSTGTNPNREEINMARKVKKAAKKSAPKARKAKKTVRKTVRKAAKKTVRKAAKKTARKTVRKTAAKRKPVRRARKAAKPAAAM